MKGYRRKGNLSKMWEDNNKGRTGMEFTGSTRAAENRTVWKGIVVKSSVVPNDAQGYWIDQTRLFFC